ncbi:PTS transporter subunit EIIB [Streptomyces luteocolor]
MEEGGAMRSTAEGVIAGLGGLENIATARVCVTRVRVEVIDPESVDLAVLRALDVHAVAMSGVVVQLVVGSRVHDLAAEIHELLQPESA